LKKRYLTLFVLTNDETRPRAFKVPLKVFKAASVAAGVILLVLAYVVIDYTRIKSNAAELHGLRKENTAQRIELQGFAAKFGDLESQMTRLSLFDKKLRIIANLKEPKGEVHPDQVLGMGGGSTTEEEYFGSLGSKVNELSGKMREDLNGLEQRADSQENSFTELQEHLLKQSSLLASTPAIWPARGWVTSSYGERISPFTRLPQMHRGMDIANRVGTPVFAPAAGIVLQVGGDPLLGKMIAVSHGYGMKTTYGHLSETFVRTGQRIRRGDKIGAMGDTGRSTGPHLHYEVSLNGIAVNPNRYILD
jgi:murein DD-endopeptidase MepM/ murein hydrolase activator NlpD